MDGIAYAQMLMQIVRCSFYMSYEAEGFKSKDPAKFTIWNAV